MCVSGQTRIALPADFGTLSVNASNFELESTQCDDPLRKLVVIAARCVPQLDVGVVFAK